MAMEFYKIIARQVTVFGSDEREKFVVEQRPDKTILVEVYTLPEDEKEVSRPYYHRLFTHAETKQIILRGLGNDDLFTITGNPVGGPDLIIYPGKGKDTIDDQSIAKSRKPKIKILDTE
jgi:hypothetical protein